MLKQRLDLYLSATFVVIDLALRTPVLPPGYDCGHGNVDKRVSVAVSIFAAGAYGFIDFGRKRCCCC